MKLTILSMCICGSAATAHAETTFEATGGGSLSLQFGDSALSETGAHLTYLPTVRGWLQVGVPQLSLKGVVGYVEAARAGETNDRGSDLAGVSNFYVAAVSRRQHGVELELGASLPLRTLQIAIPVCHDLRPGDPYPVGSSGVLTTCPAFGQEEIYASPYRRAALGSGYREPWLWTPDWWSLVATARTRWEHRLARVEVEATVGLATGVYRPEDHRLFAGATATSWSRCTPFGGGVTLFGSFGENGPYSLAARGVWRRPFGARHVDVTLTVPIVDWIGTSDTGFENTSIAVSAQL